MGNPNNKEEAEENFKKVSKAYETLRKGASVACLATFREAERTARATCPARRQMLFSKCSLVEATRSQCLVEVPWACQAAPAEWFSPVACLAYVVVSLPMKTIQWACHLETRM